MKELERPRGTKVGSVVQLVHDGELYIVLSMKPRVKHYKKYLLLGNQMSLTEKDSKPNDFYAEWWSGLESFKLTIK